MDPSRDTFLELLDQLERRRIFRVAVMHAGAAFVLLEAGELLAEAFQLPPLFLTAIGVLTLLGLPLVIAVALACRRFAKGLPPRRPDWLPIYV